MVAAAKAAAAAAASAKNETCFYFLLASFWVSARHSLPLNQYLGLAIVYFFFSFYLYSWRNRSSSSDSNECSREPTHKLKYFFSINRNPAEEELHPINAELFSLLCQRVPNRPPCAQCASIPTIRNCFRRELIKID